MFNSGIFWGIFIIAFGVVMIIKHLFSLDIPVVKIMFGVFLILLGFSVLFARPKFMIHSDDHTVVFSNKGLTFHENEDEYVSVFSNAELDMTSIDKVIDETIEINSVFSEMTVLLNKETKVNLRSDAVFGSVTKPDAEIVKEVPDSVETTIPTINIKATAVFGKITFVRK